VLSNKSVSVLSPGGENPMPYRFDVDALGNGKFNGIPFHNQSKKDRQIKGITFVRNSAIPTKIRNNR